MRTKIIRVAAIAAIVAIILGATSYVRAKQIVQKIVGAPMAQLTPVHGGFLPFAPFDLAPWSWAFAFGPPDYPGHVGTELYVSFVRGKVTANPSDAIARIRTLRTSEIH